MTSHPFDLQRENESTGKKVTAMDGLFWRVWQHCKLSVAICRWCVQSISITVPIFSLSQSLPLTFHKKSIMNIFTAVWLCLYWCLACTLTGQYWNPLRWTWRAECYGNKDESVFFHGMWWSEVGYCGSLKSGVAKKGKLFSNISKGETFLFRRIYTLDIAFMEH